MRDFKIIKKRPAFIDDRNYKNNWTIVRQWYQDNSSTWNPPKKFTHSLLDGGSYKIPISKQEEFLQIYCDSIMRGEPNFFHEQRSDPKFPVYFDLDIYLNSPPTIIDIKKWSLKVIEEIERWINSNISDYKKRILSIVSVPTILQLEENKYKFGIHINFPFLIIKSKKMIDMINYLKFQFGNKKPKKFIYSWGEKVLDDGVYTTKNGFPRGLRMIGSRKTEDCKNCNGCDNCLRGKIDLGRAYWPVIIFNPEENIELTTLKLIQYTSIKISKEAQELNNDIRYIYNPPSIWQKNKKEYYKNNAKNNEKQQQNFNLEEFDQIEKDSIVYNTIINYFKTKKICNKITNIIKSKKSDLYFVYTNSSRCKNLKGNRNHGSKKIYFLITPLKITQKCFCQCETEDERIFGSCRNWKGMDYNLSQIIKNVIFKPKKNINKWYETKIAFLKKNNIM